MRRIVVVIALALVALMPFTAAAVGPPLIAVGPPTELWEAFPLDPVVTDELTPAPATPAPAAGGGSQTPAASPASGTTDSSSVPWAMIALGAAVAVVSVAGILLLRRSRRDPTEGASPGLGQFPAAADPSDAASEREVTEAAATDPPAPTEPSLPAVPVAAEAAAPSEVEPLPDLSAVPPGTREALERSRRELARLAADYLELVAAGSTRPVLQLAEQREWTVARTRSRLGRARTVGILIGAGKGRAGGALSEEGRALLAEPPRPLRLAHSRDRPRPTRDPGSTRQKAG